MHFSKKCMRLNIDPQLFVLQAIVLINRERSQEWLDRLLDDVRSPQCLSQGAFPTGLIGLRSADGMILA